MNENSGSGMATNDHNISVDNCFEHSNRNKRCYFCDGNICKTEGDTYEIATYLNDGKAKIDYHCFNCNYALQVYIAGLDSDSVFEKMGSKFLERMGYSDYKIPYCDMT